MICTRIFSIRFKRKSVTTLFNLSLLLFSLCGDDLNGKAAAGQRNVEDLVRQSRFIFYGTVKELNATTVPAVAATSRTAVVKVDEVLYAPTTLGDFTGQEITVRLSQPASVRIGERVVFFTNAWLYGQSIAVLEIGRVLPGGDLSDLRRQISDTEQRIADDSLRGRVASAQLIIAGKVSAVRPTDEHTRRRPITEHDPDWYEATVEVASVLKGRAPRPNVTILFPNSTDAAWDDAPKFRVGQEGIWILRRDQREKGWPTMLIAGYTALSPLDFQPTEQSERIRRMIGRLRARSQRLGRSEVRKALPGRRHYGTHVALFGLGALTRGASSSIRSGGRAGSGEGSQHDSQLPEQ